MEDQSRKIRFEKPKEESAPSSVVVAKTSDGSQRKRTKVENNPRAVLFLLLFSVGVTFLVWVLRSAPSFFSEISSPKVVSFGGNNENKRKIDWPRLRQEIETKISGSRGDYAIYVYDLSDGGVMGIREREIMTAASLIKLPLLAALYQGAEAGNIGLDTKYVLKDADKVGGAGSMAYAKAGTTYTYRKMAELMGQQSDNTAFHIISGVVGKQKVKETISKIGMVDTDFENNKTTAYDVGLIFRGFYEKDILNKKNSEEILSYLTKTIFEDRIPQAIPTGIRVAHKVGTEIGVVSDAGVVFGKFPYVISILSEGVAQDEAKIILPEISKLVWNYLEN